MTIEFKPVTLDSGDYDNEAMLAFRDGKLLAILTCLSALHGDKEGQWFLETKFADPPEPTSRIFMDLHDAEAWLDR
ncbi:MAG: hypothetical protein ACSLE1_16200 [Sphingobium sp.]